MKKLLVSENDMKAFGEKIGRAVSGGECIELVGDIGSGKTTLTKGIAKGLGVTETVQSPTFTINRTYDSPKALRLSHYDFYRLADPGIMADELEESLAHTDTVVVIEWGEIVAPVLPDEHLRISFQSPTETTRELTLEGNGVAVMRLMGLLA